VRINLEVLNANHATFHHATRPEKVALRLSRGGLRLKSAVGSLDDKERRFDQTRC